MSNEDKKSQEVASNEASADVVVEKTIPQVDAKKEKAAELAAAEKARREEKRLEQKFKRGAILIAEDDAGLQNALAQEAEDRGFQVARASDGIEAVRKTTTQNFDVILIDMNLPKKLGHEAVKDIRTSSMCKDSIIVVLSGYLKKEVVESLVGKIQKAFTKPADIETVMDAIVALADQKTAQKGSKKAG